MLSGRGLRVICVARSLWAMRAAIAVAVCWFAGAATMWAGNPRWVTGPPYFTTTGLPVVWYTNQPLYFTDPGDLSSSVDHAAADAIVAAAAAVWNVPTASLVLGYGGALDEHVSEANAFASESGVIFPADVQSSNYAAKQIAVIYDTDGSVTDLLLGNGASDPSGCRQNAVTESVDSIVPAGFIQHAVLVLNGLCTGPDPEQQMQMQYQLMRAFGRVLGLGWSQTNDNVFTDSPAPTNNQALNWPIMHPIDIVCGPYSYQCLPQPFTLRMDDLSALAELYFIPQGQAALGKTDSLNDANQIYGVLQFPTGQGMQGVNVVVRRWAAVTDASGQEGWYSVSSVTGFLYRRLHGNPVTGTDTSETGSMGTTSGDDEGYYELTRIAILNDGYGYQNVLIDTEPVNPLYTGQYSVGPYLANTVNPSGSDVEIVGTGLFGYSQTPIGLSTVGPASSCDTGADGTEAAPAAVASSGWWTGLLCADGHTAWATFAVKGNRSYTIEVTAEDEQGFVSTQKATPVIGIWNATDALGSLPGIAAAGEAFNGEASGMTTLGSQSTQPNQLRIAIADQRGAGRPDFNYQARVLYADALAPASVAAAGGTVTITGMGFRTGNSVTVNGVEATVLSWSATSIVATVPSLSALGSSTGLVADVEVDDLSTGGSTVMMQALTYGTPVPVLNLLSAPSGTVIVSQVASVPFAVQMLGADGVTPVANQPIVFTATGGMVQFGACGAGSCTVMTNALGIASTTVTPLTTGAIVLSAVGSAGTQAASFTAVVQLRTATPVQATEYLAEGATVVWTPQITLTDNTASTAGVLVNWQTSSGPIVLSPIQTQASAQGIAETVATTGPLAAGAEAVATGCAWTSVCASFMAYGVAASDLRLVVTSGANQTVNASSTLVPVVLLVTDTASHPVAGAVVQVYQTVNEWEATCPARGPCPIAPVYASSSSSAVSDANGMITVTPQQLSGVAGVTNIAAATGTQGFVSLALQEQP
jgi:IPT/TIG domain